MHHLWKNDVQNMLAHGAARFIEISTVCVIKFVVFQLKTVNNLIDIKDTHVGKR